MHPSLGWAVAGIALVMIEMAAGTFFLLWFGVGAFLTAVFAVFVKASWAQYVFFALVSIVLVLLTRRWAARLTGPAARAANMDALVGQEGRVIEVIDGPGGRGTIRVAGETWLVETQGGAPLKQGQTVVVRTAKGNTLIVE